MSSGELVFRGVDLSIVYNRNTVRVLRRMEEFFTRYPSEVLNEKDYRDIFALALNRLPARYVQSGTIVLGDVVSDEDIDSSLLWAYDKVLDNPKS